MTLPKDRTLEDLSARARIRDAAMVEFGDKGFKAATMKSIAAAAGVSVGLVQHHFGTKDGLRAACDDRVLDLVRFKTESVEDGTISHPSVLSSLMGMAPLVQRYIGRALVEDSTGIQEMVGHVMTLSERFLTTQWPERFTADSQRTRVAAAVLTAINTGPMVLQAHVARRIQVEPFSEEALTRIGIGFFDVFEAFADFTDSEVWKDLRVAIDKYQGERR